MASTRIEWTECTWNPVTGCTKISEGCRHCYAERMSVRLRAMGQPRYRNGFEVTLHPELLTLPLRWKRPRRVFVNSMSDLFHESIPDSYIEQVFIVIRDSPRHTFQVLTKRSRRLRGLANRLAWPKNLWMGVTVESARQVSRMDDLRVSGALVKFVSFEPLLGPVPDADLEAIDWVIAGGESGAGARPMSEMWVIDLRDACIARGVPFFFKQWGGWHPKARGRVLEGRTWNEYPKVYRNLVEPHYALTLPA